MVCRGGVVAVILGIAIRLILFPSLRMLLPSLLLLPLLVLLFMLLLPLLLVQGHAPMFECRALFPC